MKPTIHVENLSKLYRLGAAQTDRYKTLRESLTSAITAPIRRLRNGGESSAGADLWALKGVGFDVRPGEAIGIIGRNGAGKSTLLKVISRITAPTTGMVELRGRVGSLLEVGTGFHQELTGRENIFLNGAIIGMTRKEITRQFDKIVAFSEIGKFIDTPVKRYSSGMYVRLAFAVAAHMEPEILLIDEVLSVGDLAFQRKCMDHAKRMLQRKVTLLFVSHNMFAIKAMCSRAIYLSGGQLVLDGTTEQATRLYDQDSRLDMAPWARNMVGNDPTKCDIFIKSVEILDQSDQPCTMFDHGQPMRLRLHYHASRPVTRPNFAVTFMRSDEIGCCNYSSVLDNLNTGTVTGEGVVEVRVPPLKLVSDLYTVHVLVWDEAFQKLYCAQTGQTFHIRHQLLNTEFGVYHEPAEWSITAS